MENRVDGYLTLCDMTGGYAPAAGYSLYTCTNYWIAQRIVYPRGSFFVKHRTTREPREIFNSNKRIGGEMVTEE